MSGLADKAMMAFVRVHDAVYRGSRGLIGHRIPGAPAMLMLHTTGARTGLPRTHSLAYFRDGAGDCAEYLIVASNGGAERNPAWYHNLKAGRVEVNVGTRRFGVKATPVLPGDRDYPRLWRIVNAGNAGRYQAYQARTRRPIPVIRLSPVTPRPTTPIRTPRPASPE